MTVPLACRRWQFATTLCLSLPMFLPVRAQEAARPPEARAAKVPVMDLALRVETAEGAFVVFDAITQQGYEREGRVYLAYWHDVASAEVYVFDRVLRTPADVGRALLDLSRDFVVDTGAILSGIEWMPDAWAMSEDRSAEGAVWVVATRNVMLETMGFEAFVSEEEDLPITTASSQCCQPVAMSTRPGGGKTPEERGIWLGPDRGSALAPSVPIDGAGVLELIDRTLEVVACPPGSAPMACGGGGPSGCAADCHTTGRWACDDCNPCTSDWCTENPSGGCQCAHQPAGFDYCFFMDCYIGQYTDPCGDSCCQPGEQCCDGCGGLCCPHACNGCANHGALTAGTIEVTGMSGPWAAVGDIITFTLVGASDTGGSKYVKCDEQQIPPALNVSWLKGRIGDAAYQSGEGTSTSIVFDPPGTYFCSFTVSTNRECPPSPSSVVAGPVYVNDLEP